MGTSLLKTSIFWCACIVATWSNAQTISYQWLNMGCATVMTCDGGCTACNLPDNESPNFFGTNAIWVGTAPCPYPTSSGDNSILSTGWPMFPSNDHYSLLSVLAMVPMQIDSIIIRHARTSTGPERLKVSYSSNPAAPFIEVVDQYVDWNFQTTVITDLGCLEIPVGNPYAIFQLKMQAYEGTSEGAWALDEIKIVGTPCGDISTGIGDRTYHHVPENIPYVDVLGRPVSGPDVAPGVYMGGRKVVTVF